MTVRFFIQFGISRRIDIIGDLVIPSCFTLFLFVTVDEEIQLKRLTSCRDSGNSSFGIATDELCDLMK
jgi:hypothetical protein